jgi:hypothetical protein
MRRKRMEKWSGGKRLSTFTTYQVPDPSAVVVELAVEGRKRA